MRHGTPSDYAAPYRDRPGETTEQKLARVVAIGLEPLLAWWGRVSQDTHPGSFGHSGSEFASSVAYLAAGGRISRYAFENFSTDLGAAAVMACRALGVEPNWGE